MVVSSRVILFVFGFEGYREFFCLSFVSSGFFVSFIFDIFFFYISFCVSFNNGGFDDLCS